jgi:hypothetical protein
LDLVANIAN